MTQFAPTWQQSSDPPDPPADQPEPQPREPFWVVEIDGEPIFNRGNVLKFSREHIAFGVASWLRINLEELGATVEEAEQSITYRRGTNAD